MKKLAILLVGLSAYSASAATYLGTDNQATTVTNTVNVVSTNTVVKDAGGDALAINADGSINSTVSGSVSATVANTLNVVSTNTIIKDAGGDALAINADGSLNTVTAISSAGVYNVPGGTLEVRDIRQPDLEGKSAVYASSNSMVTGGTVSISGLTKSVHLFALNGECTFSINSGDSLLVQKNTSEDYDYAYTLSNGSVNLSAKDGAAICRSRIIGAQ